MRYMFCYKLIRTFRYVVGNRLNKATHRFLVIWRHAAIAFHHHFLILAQASNWVRSSGTRDDI